MIGSSSVLSRRVRFEEEARADFVGVLVLREGLVVMEEEVPVVEMEVAVSAEMRREGSLFLRLVRWVVKGGSERERV